jgi:hypothetical protein
MDDAQEQEAQDSRTNSETLNELVDRLETLKDHVREAIAIDLFENRAAIRIGRSEQTEYLLQAYALMIGMDKDSDLIPLLDELGQTVIEDRELQKRVKAELVKRAWDALLEGLRRPGGPSYEIHLP